MITYLSFALAITLLIASPGPVVALVLADGRGTWPTWTILGGILSAQILLACALLSVLALVVLRVGLIDINLPWEHLPDVASVESEVDGSFRADYVVESGSWDRGFATSI